MKKDRILVVDDDPSMTKLLEVFFKDTFEIIISHSVSEANDELSEGEFDAIILDLNISGENGNDVLTHIRKEQQLTWLPVIILSGKDKSTDRIESLELGADDFLLKPFNPQELNLRLARLIKKYRLLQEAK